jgi:anti-sigma regulatory factor (Ser/Thr protein kinase)
LLAVNYRTPRPGDFLCGEATSQHGKGVVVMTASTRLLAPAPGSAWIPRRPGEPPAIDAGTFALATLPTSPFWARRYIRLFLGSCRGIGADIADTAELLVSELVTNAVRFAGSPASAQQYSDRVSGGMIWLSVRHFGDGLLIEVFDTDASPPVLTDAAEDAENGRGLLLVDALSREWSYFFPPCGGKVVYCFIEIPHAAGMTHRPPARAGLDTARAGPWMAR